MQIEKSFDVKINVVYPYLTKNISKKDSERISRSTLFKYETQKNITSSKMAAETIVSEEGSEKKVTERLVKRFKTIYDNFDQMGQIAERKLSEIVYEYDPANLEHEAITDAEEGIFGVADGQVTFENYRQAIELKKIIQEEIARRAMLEGGKNSVAA